MITEWDPYRLIEDGAPNDEFDGEIADVVNRIRNIRSPGDAASAISGVFSSSFDPNIFSVNGCTEVGAKLYAQLVSAGFLSHDA